MAFNKVEICGVNTSKLPVLKSPEMKKLFLAYQAGDRSCREKLIMVTRLVVRLFRDLLIGGIC